MKITFSSNTKRPSLKDHIKCAKMSEAYFKMSKDKSQINSNIEDEIWAHKYNPDTLNLIKINNKLIGFAWIVPCNKELMNKFLRKKNNEKTLLKKIQQNEINQKNFETLYLCASFIVPKYRGLGICTKAIIKTINKLIKIRKIKPILFSWPFNKEGYKLGLKVKKITKLKLLTRK